MHSAQWTQLRPSSFFPRLENRRSQHYSSPKGGLRTRPAPACLILEKKIISNRPWKLPDRRARPADPGRAPRRAGTKKMILATLLLHIITRRRKSRRPWRPEAGRHLSERQRWRRQRWRRLFVRLGPPLRRALLARRFFGKGPRRGRPELPPARVRQRQKPDEQRGRRGRADAVEHEPHEERHGHAAEEAPARMPRRASRGGLSFDSRRAS